MKPAEWLSKHVIKRGLSKKGACRGEHWDGATGLLRRNVTPTEQSNTMPTSLTCGARHYDGTHSQDP
jgi:hypothetical protein